LGKGEFLPPFVKEGWGGFFRMTLAAQIDQRVYELEEIGTLFIIDGMTVNYTFNVPFEKLPEIDALHSI